MASCKSPGSLEVRKTEPVGKTNAPASGACARSLVELAKLYRDANSALEVRDEKNAQLVGKAHISHFSACFANIHVDFDLDFSAKDNRVRFEFDDIQACTVNECGTRPVSCGPSDPECDGNFPQMSSLVVVDPEIKAIMHKEKLVIMPSISNNTV